MLESLAPEQLEQVAMRLKALGEPMRLRILRCLAVGERTVGEVADEVGASQPNVSRHLATLEQAGWVSRRKDGNRVYVRLCDTAAEQLCGYVCALAQREALETAAGWPAEREGSRS